jgi:hypothetical protein
MNAVYNQEKGGWVIVYSAEEEAAEAAQMEEWDKQDNSDYDYDYGTAT